MFIPTFHFPKQQQEIFKRIILPSSHFKSIDKKVNRIIETLIKKKNKALFTYIKRYDKVTMTEKNILVSKKELFFSKKIIKEDFKDAIETAINNISSFHKKQLLKDITLIGKDKDVLKQKIVPLKRVGVYVPGGEKGNTPLISSLLMSVIPAKVASVKEIVVVSPPKENFSLDPHLLYVLKQLNIKEIYKCGGVQAVGALAYGTECIKKVDLIVGPGNAYVTRAKKKVFGDVMIDGVFGPSEIVVISDGSVKASWIAADMISQCEHAGDELAVLITTNETHAKEVQKCLISQVKKLERKKEIIASLSLRSCLICTKNIEDALTITNQIAPEHLEIMTKNPKKHSESIINAGAIFLGPYSSEPIGDYICGTNHILPTNGSARFASSLGTYTFLKRINIIEQTKKSFQTLSPKAMILATAEKLSAHKAALDIRSQ